jgi:hypothetical protein
MKIVGDVDPREVIGAVFGADQHGDPIELLGTGSIIGDGTIVLTADHVIREFKGPLKFAVIIQNQPQSFHTVIESDWRRDLALLRIGGYRAPDPLHVLFDVKVDIPQNRGGMHYEE